MHKMNELRQERLRQLHGAVQFAGDAFQGGASAVERAQQDIARRAYGLTACLARGVGAAGLVAPVQRIEDMQHRVTAGVYDLMRAGGRAAAGAAGWAVERLANGL